MNEMEDLLKDELITLYDEYNKQKTDEMNVDYNYAEYKSYLDYQLLGASKFIKSIAYKIENVELLGLAAKIELDVLHDIEEENQAHNDFYQYQSEEYDFSMKARKFCIQLFYEEPRYRADMTRYNELIEANIKILEQADLLKKLKRYVDEKTYWTKSITK